MNINGGEPLLLVKSKEPISNAVWSPTGKEILFIKPTPIRSIDDEGDYIEIVDLPVWFNGSGFIDHYRNYLYLVDVDSGITTQLTNGMFNVEFACFSNDGRKIAYISVDDWRRSIIRNVYILVLETMEVSKVTKDNLSVSSIDWSPNDKQLLLQACTLERGWASHYHLWILDLESGHIEPLTKQYDRNTMAFVSSDSIGPYRVRSHPKWCSDGNIYVG